MSTIDDALLKLRALGYAEEAYAAAKKVDALRAALKLFADFAEAYGPVAMTLDYPEDHVLLQVGTAPEAKVVRLQDFYAANAALGEDT